MTCCASQISTNCARQLHFVVIRAYYFESFLNGEVGLSNPKSQRQQTNFGFFKGHSLIDG